MDNRAPILMTEEYWRNSQFSIARFYGGINYNGQRFVVVNKDGKDLYQCSMEAEKEGRAMAIEPGEPADLIDERYLPIYREIGRKRFIKILKDNQYLNFTPELFKEKANEQRKI